MKHLFAFINTDPVEKAKTVRGKISVICFLSLIVLFGSCKKDIKSDTQQQTSAALRSGDEINESNFARVNSNMVLTWNEAATIAVERMTPLTGSGPLPPMPESRIYAMVNVAMHDALNTIHPKYERYALTGPGQGNASPDAAVAQSAHDIIVSLLPPQQVYADSLLNVSLNSIPNGNAKTNGINIGIASAAAMISKRQNDGVANAQFPVAQGTLPGEYRSTPPFDGPPFNGFMAVPGWGDINPFSLNSGTQFRPVPPYPINSIAYTKDYIEIKKLGSVNSTVRTADQTQIALFWLENAPSGWNRIARNLVTERHLDAWKTARLLGLLQMAEADANIAAFNAKYHYFFWRPITAVRLGDSDGNPFTVGDANWDVLAPPTPPIPDYPSNHAVNGGAAAGVMAAFFEQDQICFSATSSSLPGVTRSYTSLSQAAWENALSRIYVGYHFRHAVAEGQKQGLKIGLYVFTHSLRPI